MTIDYEVWTMNRALPDITYTSVFTEVHFRHVPVCGSEFCSRKWSDVMHRRTVLATFIYCLHVIAISVNQSIVNNIHMLIVPRTLTTAKGT